MRIAHLILAHKNPQQLERMIKALQHPSFSFFIHVDKKSDIQPFEYLSEIENVSFIKNRTKVYWAGYGTIQATINGLEEIPFSQFDYVNVTSAQDFPLKTPGEIYNFFLNRKGKEFITCEPVETKWKEAKVRVTKYHLINWRIPGKFQLEKIVNAILPERKFPFDFELAGRSNWFTITNQAAKYLLEFIHQHPKYIRFFKYSWGGDELFFSIILYNSHFKERIVNNVVYVDWSEKKAHPKVLKKEDYNVLLSTDKLFGRKFDVNIDADIITMLENKLAIKK